jgi:putative membrane protein
MKTTIATCIIALFVFATFSCQKEDITPQNSLQSNDLSASSKQNSLNAEDSAYLVGTSQGSQLEIILGNMAQTHARDTSVIRFGMRMIDDHTRQHSQVKNVAENKNLMVPDQPAKDDLDEIVKLSHLYGDDFDKEYISFEVWDHKHDIRDGVEELRDGKDHDVKTLALRWAPILTAHLVYAEWIAKKVDAPTYHE